MSSGVTTIAVVKLIAIVTMVLVMVAGVAAMVWLVVRLLRRKILT